METIANTEWDIVVNSALDELINLYKNGFFPFCSELNLKYFSQYNLIKEEEIR